MEQPPDLAAERAHPWTRPHVVLPVFVPLALVGGLLPSFTVAANLYVLLLGGAMLTAGLSRRLPRVGAPQTLPSGVAWWLMPIGIFALIEAITFLARSPDGYPTLSLLADPMLEGYGMRSLAYFGWLAAFWGLIRR